MVVDDDPTALELVSILLRAGGFEVTTCRSGIGVTQQLAAGVIDALVLDLRMPGLDGDALAGVLRRDARLRHLPIVLLSAAPEQELYEAGRAVSAAVVLKSRMEADLLSTVRGALRRAGHVRAVGGALDRAVELPAAAPQASTPLGLTKARLRVSYLDGLPAQLALAQRLWISASKGNRASHEELSRLLHLSKGEAGMLDLTAHAHVFGALQEVLMQFAVDALSASVKAAVEETLRDIESLDPQDEANARSLAIRVRWLTSISARPGAL